MGGKEWNGGSWQCDGKVAGWEVLAVVERQRSVKVLGKVVGSKTGVTLIYVFPVMSTLYGGIKYRMDRAEMREMAVKF